jgi:hypothetical protein
MYDYSTVTTILKYSDIALFLGADEYEIEKYYNWIDETDRLEIIYILTDMVRYYQPYYIGLSSYDKLVNLLYSYISRWVAQAQVVVNYSGIVVGGVIQPVAPAPIRQTQVNNKQYTASGGETTITWSDMIGQVCIYVSRGGVDVQEIVSTTPTGEQVQWNSSTGVLTFARALESTEFVRGLFN